MKHVLQTTLVVGFLMAWATPVLGVEIKVRDAKRLRNALRRVQPGTTITLASGNYGNGIWIERVNGTKKSP